MAKNTKYMEGEVYSPNTVYIFTTEWKTFGFRVLTSSNLICLVMIFEIEKKKSAETDKHLLDIELNELKLVKQGN